MHPMFPFLLTVFFGIFHFLGGGAMGMGLRSALRGSDQAMSKVLWGAGMGGVPVLFDWFFLINQGYTILGLVGPVLFIITTLASAFLELRVDPSAVISAAIGSAGFLVGVLVIPIMLDRAKTSGLEMGDYVFGAVFVLIWLVIGGSFAWSGFTAIIRGVSLNQVYTERQQNSRRSQKSKNPNAPKVPDEPKVPNKPNKTSEPKV